VSSLAVRKLRVGIVALQGDFDAHAAATVAAGGSPVMIRTPEAVREVDALILPGGESTTIGKLMRRYGIDDAIRAAHREGVPIYGTCAGMILLARRITAGEMRGGQPTLGLLDIDVVRNAFGRQVDSFEADIHAPEVARATPAYDSIAASETVRGVFIRAPIVAEAGPDVQILARYDDKIVLVRQGNILASAFHPELTEDARVHRYFFDVITAGRGNRDDS
jgi:5'-phosphate synthase pdxT subunit